MKHFFLLPITVFILLPFNFVYAQTNVFNLLNSGDTIALRQAAKIMTSKQQNTAKNLHLLADIIAQEFESAPTNRIDALSWGCRALGATGDSQYLPLLQRISQSNIAHKKLKKYANKAYREIQASPQTVVKAEQNQPTVKEPMSGISKPTLSTLPAPTQLLNQQGLIPKPSLTITQRQRFAIAKGEWQAIKFIAQQLNELEKSNAASIQVLDALSQFLYERQTIKLDSEKIDVLAWICRALGKSNNARYKLLLQNIAKQVTNKKLRNYALAASKTLKKPGTQYIVGSINFQQTIDDFKQEM